MNKKDDDEEERILIKSMNIKTKKINKDPNDCLEK